MPTLSVNGAELYYEESGKGPAIVFSHGLLWSGRMFERQVAALRERYRCITYDHRGQGQSPLSSSPFDMETLADDAAALIERLQAAPCHFVGLSMGGMVGMRLAIERAKLLRSLTLIDTAADGEPALNVPKYRLMAAVAKWVGMRPLAPPVMKIMFGRPFLRDPARAALRAEMQAELTSLRYDGMLAALQSVIARRIVSELSRIATPTLFLHGAEDRAIVVGRARRTADAIAGCRFVLVPRAGHTSTVEEPEAITRELVSFLDGR
jgi:pimeloyl-ACP methyl ester carboxylesterase